MLIGYSMPVPTGIALAGAAWLTADEGGALVDGKPARVARLQATTTPAITLTFAAAFVPRIIGVLGLRGVAPGVAVTASAAVALGGNSATQTAVRFADGTVGAWIVTDGTVATSELTITIAGAGEVDVGEVVAMPGVDVDHNRDWSSGYVDPTEVVLSRASQPSHVVRQPYRTLTATLTPEAVAKVRAGALEGGMDWQQLRSVLAGARRAVAVPRWRQPQGGVDAMEVQATALYGICKLPSIEHLGGNYYDAALEFQEIPALV